MDEGEEGNKFKYCKVCRVHYDNGRKHHYSRNHRKAFVLIVNKFRQKVIECKQYLKHPEAIDGELEPGATFWCHFCEEAIQKHVTDRVVSIKFGGLYEHFRSHQHQKNTHEFWRENGGDKKLKKDFLLSADDYAKYQLRCRDSLRELSDKMDATWIQAAERIKVNEMERLKVFSEQHQLNQTALTEVQTVTNAHGVMQNATGWHAGLRVWRGGIVKRRSKSSTRHVFDEKNNHEVSRMHDEVSMDRSTLSSPSLSVVKISTNEKLKHAGIGNIHTGALPPWLRNEDDDSKESDLDEEPPVIGPSFEDFKQHVAMSKKKRPNVKGVGRNFDHTAETSDNWLPSFGRVWNSGPRWRSRQEYRKEEKVGGALHKTSK